MTQAEQIQIRIKALLDEVIAENDLIQKEGAYIMKSKSRTRLFAVMECMDIVDEICLKAKTVDSES